MTPEERFKQIETNLLLITEGQRNVNTAIQELTAAVTRFVESADTRMKAMEANLDALIRVITAEHSNGRKKQ